MSLVNLHSDVALKWTAGRNRMENLLPQPFFVDEFERCKRRSERTKLPFSIILIRFKDLNSGVRWANNKFVKAVQKLVRESDILGFLGEDTVAVLLPDTCQEGLKCCLQKIVACSTDQQFQITFGTYPDQVFDSLSQANQAQVESFPLFLDVDVQIDSRQAFVKRAVDIFGSLLALILFFPVMCLTAILIKIDSPGPVILPQIRLGRKGAPFVMYKFRSMHSNQKDDIHREYVSNFIKGNIGKNQTSNVQEVLFKIKADPRVTRVGKFIRKTSIDELPQLYNVLKGDMSLVGPRPPLYYEASKYEAWHLRRILEMKPGMTGLWQVEGRSRTTFEEMVRLDVQYIRRWSLLGDLQILFKTIKVVVLCNGAA
jgi:exopolysaccharide biosynthesis polyprenyl glycosylphosphotransferase